MSMLFILVDMFSRGIVPRLVHRLRVLRQVDLMIGWMVEADLEAALTFDFDNQTHFVDFVQQR